MTIPISIDPRSQKLLRQAAEWRLIGLLLERPVEGWIEQVSEIAREIHDADLLAAAIAAQTQASLALYDTTFGPGGPAPPREVTYRQAFDTGGFIAQLRGFYAAFGYQDATGEPPDHVAVEAGFLAYLRLKQVFARQQGLDEQADIAKEAFDHFLQDHLSVLAQPLAQSLEESGIDYLALTARSLLQRVGPRRTPAMPSPDGGRTVNLPLADPLTDDAPCDLGES